MMNISKISKILKESGFDLKLEVKGDFKEDFSIMGLSQNSKTIQKNELYFAIKGYLSDGHDYIEDLFDKGISCFIVEKSFLETKEFLSLKKSKDFFYIIGVKEVRKALALISHHYYKKPSESLFVIGIIGTNGKTSSAYILNRILFSLGYKTAFIGTLGIYINEEIYSSNLTTPDSITLNKYLSLMKEKSIQYVFIEVTSHSLFLDRVYAIHLRGILFTSFSQDHLDFHKTMENYFEAKLKILDLLIESKAKDQFIIFNADIEKKWTLSFKKRIKEKSLEKISHYYSLEEENSKSDYSLKIKTMNKKGSLFELRGFLKEQNDNQKLWEIPLLGKYNLQNFLGVLATLELLKIPFKGLQDFFKDIEVPGRYQKIYFKQKKSWIIIDYAHTHEALEFILVSIKNDLKIQKIISIFGCGGNRDQKKRKLMGEVASRMSQFIILTNDNPRYEDPIKIIQDIIEGFPLEFKNYQVIPNRLEAIQAGISLLTEDSVLLIAGKGAETTQSIKNKNIYFNDFDTVKTLLKNYPKK